MKKMTLIFCIIFGLSQVIAQQFSVLVFSKTEGYRHESILAGVKAIKELGEKHSFAVTWTEDAKIFTTEQLAPFSVVVFLNTGGDVLNDAQQSAFEQFIKSGKGFVGIHSATTTERDWPWFGKLLGRYFKVHPEIQTAVMNVVDKNFPATLHLPEKWLWTDEWYQFEDPLIDNLKVLITVDESTYDPRVKSNTVQTDGMGAFHPIAWYHEYDGGRAFYTALGHIPASYKDPFFLEHIYGGIYWAAKGKNSGS